MSFIDEIRQELTHAPQPREDGVSRLPFSRERFEKFFSKELADLQGIIREDVRSGCFPPPGTSTCFRASEAGPTGTWCWKKKFWNSKSA